MPDMATFGRFFAMLQVRLYLDYIDPGSFLMDRRLRSLTSVIPMEVQRLPWEVRRPPDPILDASGEAWSGYWSAMAEEAAGDGLELARPKLVPWTRKAHELALLAREKGCFDKIHEALMDAFHLEGRDVGRVDALVELGRDAGLDLSETKAVLDVDRFAGVLDEVRAEGARMGVRGVPTLVCAGEVLEGIHSREAIESFLRVTAEKNED